MIDIRNEDAGTPEGDQNDTPKETPGEPTDGEQVADKEGGWEAKPEGERA